MISEDTELLRRYVEQGSADAFAELVHRRISLVYSIAWRRTRDRQRAEDAAQIVFASLARNAQTLARRPVLIGWFYRSAHNAAIDIVRSESSRAAREQEVHSMDTISGPSDAHEDWDKIRPILDETLSELAHEDRDAVLMRFFEGRHYADIGATFHITENTARMRVSRALQKLEASLGRRGIVSTGTAVSAAVAAQAATSLPPGLVSHVLDKVLGEATAAGAAASWTKQLMTAKVLLPLATLGVVLGLAVARPEAETQSNEPFPQKPAVSSARLTTASVTSAASATPAAERAMPPSKGEPASDPSGRRTILNNLRQISAARDYFLKLHNRLPDSIDDLVGEAKMIRALSPARGEDYGAVKLDSRILSVPLPNGEAVALTTDGPTRRGPPDRAETAAWEESLARYMQSRPPGSAPRLAMPSHSTAQPMTPPEFVGIMGSSTGSVFVVNDERGASHWVRKGQSVGSLVVADYRAGEETLIFKRGDAEILRKLRPAKTRSDAIDPECEIGYLALLEAQQRERWAVSDIKINKPQALPGGKWFVHLYRIVEPTPERIVPGEDVLIHFNAEGAVESYRNRGVRK